MNKNIVLVSCLALVVGCGSKLVEFPEQTQPLTVAPALDNDPPPNGQDAGNNEQTEVPKDEVPPPEQDAGNPPSEETDSGNPPAEVPDASCPPGNSCNDQCDFDHRSCVQTCGSCSGDNERRECAAKCEVVYGSCKERCGSVVVVVAE